jgi:hypothetical protein
MKRKLALLIVLTIILSTTIVPAYAQETSTITISDQDNSSKIVVSYKKTITKYYSDYYSIPQSIYYEEYKDGTWFSGTLFLVSTQVSGNGWLATFTGTLQGNM